MINALLMGLTLGLVVYTSFQANEDFNPAVGGAFVLGFYSIALGLILNLVANRFIRKDEMLVRSVDRIR
jgi:ABC-type sulfate transport system permease component